MLTRIQVLEGIIFFDTPDGGLPLYYDDGSGEREITFSAAQMVPIDYVAKGVQKKRIVLVKYSK